MPLYEYRCAGCRRTFDAFRPAPADGERRPAAPCPDCGRPGEVRYSAPVVDNQSVGRNVHSGDTTKTRRVPQVNREREQAHAHRRAENDRLVREERAHFAESRGAQLEASDRLAAAREAILSGRADG